MRGVGAGDAGFVGMDAALQPQRRHHLRHHRLVAVFADSHLDLVGEVDAFDLLQEAVDEMLARLLAFGDDIDAGIFLQLYRQHGGVTLGARELGPCDFQGAHSLLGSASHSGFGSEPAIVVGNSMKASRTVLG